MDINVYNTQFQLEATVDVYDSLIWTERYNECGDFEIVVPLEDQMLQTFRLERYLQIASSNMTMIVENIQISTDAENGDKMTVSGRSLESILDRRIIWGLQVLNGNFQNAIKSLLDKSIISPSIADRRIPNFVFRSSSDTKITGLQIEAQFTGDNIYDVISNLCYDRDLGFRILLTEDGIFEFGLYSGTDRTYDQFENPYVAFSPEFENLLDSTYKEETGWIKTVTLVAGEDQGTSRRYASVGTGSGLARREIFTDARDIQSEVTDVDGKEITLTDAQYTALLQQRGSEKLAEIKEDPTFDCEIETKITYIANQDFFKGDLVQISNGRGQEAKARIKEIIISDDANGTNVYPTFEVII